MSEKIPAHFPFPSIWQGGNKAALFVSRFTVKLKSVEPLPERHGPRSLRVFFYFERNGGEWILKEKWGLGLWIFCSNIVLIKDKQQTKKEKMDGTWCSCLSLWPHSLSLSWDLYTVPSVGVCLYIQKGYDEISCPQHQSITRLLSFQFLVLSSPLSSTLAIGRLVQLCVHGLTLLWIGEVRSEVISKFLSLDERLDSWRVILLWTAPYFFTNTSR